MDPVRRLVRETSYGRTSQPLADFLAQGLIALLLSAVLGALFTRVWTRSPPHRAHVVGVVRGFTAMALSALLLVAPIVIEPLFNECTPVPAGPVRDAIVEMAQPIRRPHRAHLRLRRFATSNNFTANVAGLGGSARIAISDVAFKGASLTR